MKRRARKTFIYALYDPRKPMIMRYVGKANDVEKRLEKHIKESMNQCRCTTHKANWIRSLLKIDITPKVKILEQIAEKRWQSCERHWIKIYRQRNHPLTNGTDGGDGLVNPSVAVRDKMSKAQYGKLHTAKTKYRMSRSHRGEVFSKERRIRIGKSLRQSSKFKSARFAKRGVPRSLEVRLKISNALSGKPKSVSHKLKLRKALIGKPWSDARRLAGGGKPRSKETRNRMSIARSLWWANYFNMKRGVNA